MADGVTVFAMNGEELFRLPVEADKGDGYFALRLWKNHVRFTDFDVTMIE